MTPTTLSDRKAHLLLRIRWLAWGAIAALLAIHASNAVVPRDDPDPRPYEQTEAGCRCSSPTTFI